MCGCVDENECIIEVARRDRFLEKETIVRKTGHESDWNGDVGEGLLRPTRQLHVYEYL